MIIYLYNGKTLEEEAENLCYFFKINEALEIRSRFHYLYISFIENKWKMSNCSFQSNQPIIVSSHKCSWYVSQRNYDVVSIYNLCVFFFF